MNNPMKKKQLTWVYVTLLGVVLFLVAWLILAVYSADVTLSVTTYFFLLVLAALAATAFLTGALHSSSRYEGNVYKGKLQLSGSVVVFLLILIAGYKFRPQPPSTPFDLTIYAYGDGGKGDPVAHGIIRVRDGNETKSGSLDSNGRAVIAHLSAANLGEKMMVTAAVRGYHMASGDTLITIPRESLPVIFVPLLRNHDSLLVRGQLLNREGRVVGGARLSFTAFGRQASTDEQGHFQVYLPTAKGQPTGLLIIEGGQVIFNADIITDDFLSIQADQ